jgi:hypothetical protein
MSAAQSIRWDEIQSFLQFAMGQWPEMRANVVGQLAQRCDRCLLSERYVPLYEGCCELCRIAAGNRSAAPIRPAPAVDLEASLRQFLQGFEGRGVGRYDALVLFSGGKDSAFLLHRLRSEFPGLRLLAVTVDSGFLSQVAKANCQRIHERLDGVDHVFFTPPRPLFVKAFRHALTHLNPGGCYTTVDRIDGDLTFDIGRHLAAAQAIPLLIAGLSPAQVERILGLHTFQSRPEDERQRRTHTAGFPLEVIFNPVERRQYWWDGTAWPPEQIPRVIYPFYAWSYDEAAIRREVVQLGLLEAGQDNPLATNNDLVPVMLALDNCRFGYSGFEPEFAEMIRAGQSGREPWLSLFQAVEYLSAKGEFMPRSIAETLGRLELTHADLGLPVV